MADIADPGVTALCLSRIGAAMLAGGSPVNEVETEVRRIGAALGWPQVSVAATSTGLFLGLTPDQPVSFRPVTTSLRFDQADLVARVGRDLGRTSATPLEAMTRLDAAFALAPRVRPAVADAAVVVIGVGIALILQPALANVIAAAVCSVLVAVLVAAARRSALLQTLLPIVAAFAVTCLVLAANDASWLDGPLRTVLPPLAILLPGAALVTGMSEVAAGAMVAGTARLVFGAVQLLLFSVGVLSAVTVMGTDASDLGNVRLENLGPWSPWVGLVLIAVGVVVNVSAPRGAVWWILIVLASTFATQTVAQSHYGVAVAGFLGAAVAALVAAAIQRIPAGPPALVVFQPAFWLLVPGSLGLLSTTQLAVDRSGGLQEVITTVAVIVAIALGVLVGSAVGRAVDQLGRSRR